jgi:hypothetical protein
VHGWEWNSKVMMNGHSAFLRRVRLVATGLFLTIGALAVASAIAGPQAWMINGDFFELWLAGRLLPAGRMLYDTQSWMPLHPLYGNLQDRNPVFPYPPVAALPFLLLGRLPLAWASTLWVTLSIGMVAGSALLCLSLWRPRPGLPYLLPILAGALLFRPALVTFINGQLSALFLMVLILAGWSWERDRTFLGGLFLPVLALRPNLGLPILALVGLWLVARRHWSAVCGMMVSGLVMLALSWLLAPGWINPWLQVGDGKLWNTFGFHPSLWGITGTLCNHELGCTLGWGTALALPLALASLMHLVRLDLNTSPMYVLAVLVPAGLLVTPYLWAYDQTLLLLPILVLASQLYSARAPYLIVAVFPLAVSVLALLLIPAAFINGNDAWSGLLSVVLLACLMLRLTRRKLRFPRSVKLLKGSNL